MGAYRAKLKFIYSSEPFDPSDKPPTYYIKGSCDSITAGCVLKELVPYLEYIWDNPINELDDFAESRGELSTKEAYSSTPENNQYSLTIMVDANAYTYSGDGTLWLNDYYLSKEEVDNGLHAIISAIENGTDWIGSEDDFDTTGKKHIGLPEDQSDLTGY